MNNKSFNNLSVRVKYLKDGVSFSQIAIDAPGHREIATVYLYPELANLISAAPGMFVYSDPA